MSCEAVRDRLLKGESEGEVARHLAVCPECARFAERWGEARAVLGRRLETAPPPGFAHRVVDRLPGSTEVLGRWALRALPAAVVLALALAWIGLGQAPYPSTALLAEEPSPELLFTYSALGPPAPAAAEAPR